MSPVHTRVEKSGDLWVQVLVVPDASKVRLVGLHRKDDPDLDQTPSWQL